MAVTSQDTAWSHLSANELNSEDIYPVLFHVTPRKLFVVNDIHNDIHAHFSAEWSCVFQYKSSYICNMECQ